MATLAWALFRTVTTPNHVVNMAFSDPPSGGDIDPQLQRFVQQETQKARFQANVHQFTGQLLYT